MRDRRRCDQRGIEPRRGQILEHAKAACFEKKFSRLFARRLRRIVGEQELRAEVGAADPPAGVDARTEQEAEMPRLGRAGEPHHIHQRGQADTLAGAHRDQPLGDEGAVESDQRRDIGDGAERDVMQHAEQVGLGHLGGKDTTPAQLAIDRDQRHQREPDGGEMSETGHVIWPVRVHQCIDLGQLLARLVMIDHDHGHAEAFRLG